MQWEFVAPSCRSALSLQVLISTTLQTLVRSLLFFSFTFLFFPLSGEIVAALDLYELWGSYLALCMQRMGATLLQTLSTSISETQPFHLFNLTGSWVVPSQRCLHLDFSFPNILLGPNKIQTPARQDFFFSKESQFETQNT